VLKRNSLRERGLADATITVDEYASPRCIQCLLDLTDLRSSPAEILFQLYRSRGAQVLVKDFYEFAFVEIPDHKVDYEYSLRHLFGDLREIDVEFLSR
jgi:hypothetical protein